MTAPAPQLVRDAAGWTIASSAGAYALEVDLATLLERPLAEAERLLADSRGAPVDPGERVPLAPVDRQEVWAAGVTYRRSLEGRLEESGASSLYDHVYESARPELFFKSAPERVVGPRQPVGIRADSEWNVPEPELALVLNAELEIFGLTIGNDMSSRSIEGENALFLPQAKVYDGACALGPAILVVAGELGGARAIDMRIERDGTQVWVGRTSTAQLHRGPRELADWLGRAMSFPHGVVLMTGTGIVPEREFTLTAGDEIEIEIEGLGTLRNPVVTVGADGAA